MFRERLIEIRTKFGEPRANTFFRLSLITHLVGELNRDIAYMHRLPQEANAHRANTRVSFADLLAQLSVLCIELGIDEEELRELGLERFEEKCAEFKKRGWVEV